jgi:RHS repeat-associated protein
VYDTAGNIASKQVEKPALAATMTTYGHNSLNQLTASGGSGGTKTVIVRGETTEPASVKVKPGTATTWKNARMLAGQRFEADIDLATGPNQINIQAKDGSNNTSNYTYALDLAAAPAATPTHDADGNLLSDGVRSYAWDLQNRLIKITWGAGTNKTTEFRYNPLGQRSQRIEKTGTTTTAHHYYLYDGIRLLSRYTGGTAASNIDRRYFNEGEQRKNGAAWDGYHYTRDHLGSIREVLAANGTLVARYDYDPYGKRTAQYEASGYGCDLGYTGHITQPSPVALQTELVMTLFRAYDPELGRWLSADPLGEEDSLNLYQYVQGDPIGRLDDDGLRGRSFRYPNRAAARRAIQQAINQRQAEQFQKEIQAARCAANLQRRQAMNREVEAAQHGHARGNGGSDQMYSLMEAMIIAGRFLGPGSTWTNSGLGRSADGTRTVRWPSIKPDNAGTPRACQMNLQNSANGGSNYHINVTTNQQGPTIGLGR